MDNKLNIDGQIIESRLIDSEEYVRLKDFENVVPDARLDYWLRNIGTVDFLEAWEREYNPDFKLREFQEFKISRPLTQLNISASKWMEFGGVSLFVKRGRYGATWGHIDVALHYAAWLSPIFNVKLNRAFRVMLEERIGSSSLTWVLDKIEDNAQENYHLSRSIRQELDLPKRWDPKFRDGKKDG